MEFPDQPIPATRGFVSPSESPVHQPFDTSQTIKGLEQKPAQAPPPKAQKEATPPTPLGKGKHWLYVYLIKIYEFHTDGSHLELINITLTCLN